MTEYITAVEAIDVRFPTSPHLDGSDAMNPDPDYSAAYVVAAHRRRATRGTGSSSPSGGATTIEVAADRGARAACRRAAGRRAARRPRRCSARQLDRRHPAALARARRRASCTWPIGGVVNAVWDLAARRAGQPLWQLLADLTPEQIVDLVDFRYLTDALTRDEALDLLRAAARGPGRARPSSCSPSGYPAYTTSPGWLGYDDEKLARLCRGGGRRRLHPDQAQGRRGPRRRRAADGASPGRRSAPDIRIAIDANQTLGRRRRRSLDG